MTDEQHLVRAAIADTDITDSSRIDDLSNATGLERLALSTLHVAPGDCVTVCCDAGSEAFLYVHTGQGCMRSENTDITFAAGDFVAFQPPPAQQTVSNTGSDLLVCLLGGDGASAALASSAEH